MAFPRIDFVVQDDLVICSFVARDMWTRHVPRNQPTTENPLREYAAAMRVGSQSDIRRALVYLHERAQATFLVLELNEYKPDEKPLFAQRMAGQPAVQLGWLVEEETP